MNVPRSTPAYWRQKARGERVRPVRLPTPAGETSLGLDPVALVAADPLNLLLPVIEDLRGQKGGYGAEPDSHGRLRFGRVLASPAHVDRALIFLDALLRRLGEFGCHAEAIRDHPWPSRLVIRQGGGSEEVMITETVARPRSDGKAYRELRKNTNGPGGFARAGWSSPCPVPAGTRDRGGGSIR